MDKNHLFLYIYSYCFITEGTKQYVIINTSKGEIYRMDNNTLPFLKLIKIKKISECFNIIKPEDKHLFKEFINFLIEKELGNFVTDISRFPEIEEYWNEPKLIKHAIIDIRGNIHNFENIFNQLSDLGCSSVEIRSYRELSIFEISGISDLIGSNRISSLTIITPIVYTIKYIKQISSIIRKTNLLMKFCFYNVETDKWDFIKENIDKVCLTNINLLEKNIESSSSCGDVDNNKKYCPSLKGYMESKLYNSCLNKMISIDENGLIKNCPAFQTSYGHIDHILLKDVAMKKEFQHLWYINKDVIESCKECELRYFCVDCRAFRKEQSIYSKPLKCSYDPNL